MSHIDNLIRELCPDGVEFKSLGQVGRFTRGSGIQKADLIEDGVGAIHYGQIHTHYGTWAAETKSFVAPDMATRLKLARTGDLVIATTSEDDEAVGKAVAWVGQSEIAVSTDAYIFQHSLDPKYVSYFFQTGQFHIQKRRFITGTKVRRISGNSLAKIRIPVPPSEVQGEIVRVLDLFQSLEAELEAELEARRLQYEHYRHSLLSFEREGVRWLKLGEMATFKRGTAITQKATIPGDIPVVANAPASVYQHNRSNRSGETVVVARSGAYAGSVTFWDRPIFLTDAFSIHPDAKVMGPRFLFYALLSRQDVIRSTKKGAGVPHVRVVELQSFELPVPPLEDQERIFGILDKFDALVNDLSIGLPAALAARHNQYEHYRDRLLTFKEVA